MIDVIVQVASWISWKTSTDFTVEMILSGKESYDFDDGSELTVVHGPFDDAESTVPVAMTMTYVNDDSRIAGRQWITEMHLEREPGDYVVEFSLHLFVADEDHEAWAPSPSRPRLMVSIADECRPVGSTPGLFTRNLTLDSAEKFVSDARNPERDIPLVVVSNSRKHNHKINLDRMREQMLGVADLYVIPFETNNWNLSEVLGEDLACYGTAIRIIWPIASDGQATNMLILSKGKNGLPRTNAKMEQIAIQHVLRWQMARLAK
jgi:hypothetical protein